MPSSPGSIDVTKCSWCGRPVVGTALQARMGYELNHWSYQQLAFDRLWDKKCETPVTAPAAGSRRSLYVGCYLNAYIFYVYMCYPLPWRSHCKVAIGCALLVVACCALVRVKHLYATLYSFYSWRGPMERKFKGVHEVRKRWGGLGINYCIVLCFRSDCPLLSLRWTSFLCR